MTRQILPFTQDSFAFNVYAGKADKFESQDIQRQISLISEELKETIEGFESNSAVEVLDGTIDILVVTLGLLQKLQYAGVDIEGALSAVAENNLSKFTEDPDVASLTVASYQRKGEAVYVTDFGAKKVIKRLSDDKVMKPIDFKSVELDKFIPEELLKNGFKSQLLQ